MQPISKDNQFQILESPLTYEERRLKYKNGVLSGFFIFFKSTVGLGLLVSQYYFGEAGAILAPITSLLSCLLIFFTMNLITTIADEIEEAEAEQGTVIENYDQITERVLGNTMKIIVKLFCFFINEGVTIVNVTNFSKYIMPHISMHFNNELFHVIEFYKLLSIVMIIFLLVFILEPEKLKYPSYAATIILVMATIYMWVTNGVKTAQAEKLPAFDLFNFSNLPALVGFQLYAFESIGSLFTVRSTLARPKDMHKVMKITFVFIFILFSGTGLSFILVK